MIWYFLVNPFDDLLTWRKPHERTGKIYKVHSRKGRGRRWNWKRKAPEPQRCPLFFISDIKPGNWSWNLWEFIQIQRQRFCLQTIFCAEQTPPWNTAAAALVWDKLLDVGFWVKFSTSEGNKTNQKSRISAQCHGISLMSSIFKLHFVPSLIAFGWQCGSGARSLNLLIK